jgi:hypothetical protein
MDLTVVLPTPQGFELLILLLVDVIKDSVKEAFV